MSPTTRCCGRWGSGHYILYGLQHCNYTDVIGQEPSENDRVLNRDRRIPRADGGEVSTGIGGARGSSSRLDLAPARGLAIRVMTFREP